jgi:hypothetical protein
MTADEQELVDQIHRAFAGVSLEDGTSLNMTEYNDSGGCMPEFMEKAKADERNDWTAITDETLERFTVTFSFTDLKGFRFYIPAYMIWTIRNHRTSDCIIGFCTIYAIRPSHHLFKTTPFWQWFTREQIDAMTKFLEYVAQDDDSSDGQEALENLSKIRLAQPFVGGTASSPRSL